ncbi:hypothetical protein AB0K18_17500 [Nonomuraea sp. NPDC049421]|uniref:hypothetical protein n=1 Tax=Nonomuraea sp. NPDC049421 TaxID=3155275 RepID=UPI0034284FF0
MGSDTRPGRPWVALATFQAVQAVLGVAAVVAGQQRAVLANISAQGFRDMAAPILIGALLVPLLLGSLVPRRRPVSDGPPHRTRPRDRAAGRP